MKVAVIGAGIVGCSTAYELVRRGHDVVLVDAAAGPGLGASFANGGQLSYSFVEPLANPATLRGLPGMLLDRQSALRLRLRADPRQWAWGLRFLAACTARQAAHGTRALLALAARSRRALDAWVEADDLSFSLVRNGKLVLSPDAAILQRQTAQVVLQAASGAAQEVLDRAQCIAREPALAGYRGFVGGVWTPGECVGDPHLLCRSLLRAASSRGHVETLFGAPVRRFVLSRGRAVAAETASGVVAADAFVVAAGAQAPALGAMLGEALPIHPIKGYSVTLALRPGRAPPTVSVTDLGRKMVLAPLGGELRVAAMAEMGVSTVDVPPDRVQRMLAAVEAVYPGLCDASDPRPWAGLRPATPDSVPIIRRARVLNVVLNVGHGALGLTLAAGSAERVAELLA